MSDENALFFLKRQFDTAWKLASHHLNGLTTEQCLWRPSSRGPHVFRSPDGVWHADWPEHEIYDAGPPSIAWLTWHISFWWAMVLDHSIGARTLKREDVVWEGSAERALARIDSLRSQWLAMLDEIRETDLEETVHTRWPFSERPFGDVLAFVNLELTKNAAEIGFVRFLFAQRLT